MKRATGMAEAVMKRISCAAVAIMLFTTAPAYALSGPAVCVSAAELTSMESGLDGERVCLEGEVISEALRGGDGHVWLNVRSGGVAVGVWMPREMAERVERFGGWGQSGDTVRVTGTFHEACDIHGGDLGVHAEDLTVIKPGSERRHPVQHWKLAPGVAGLTLAGVLLVRARREEGA